MTLLEAIAHADTVADGECGSDCGIEHRQLAVWLMELHGRRVGCWKETAMSVRYNYQTVEGLEEINRWAEDGWRVVTAEFKLGVWTALMELQIQ
jgi:hypothetical protein